MTSTRRKNEKQFAALYDEKDIIIFRDRLYLNKNALVERLKVTTRTLHNWVISGILKQVNVGGRVYFRESDVEKMLEQSNKP